MTENFTISCHSWKVSCYFKYSDPLPVDLGQAHGSDVRDELRKYGREGTGKKYMELQSARRDFILKQRVTYWISNDVCIVTRSRWLSVRSQQDERRRITTTAAAKDSSRVWRSREEVIFLNAN